MKNYWIALVLTIPGFLLLHSFSAPAQPKNLDPVLLEQLQGKTNLEEIMTIVENHYKSNGLVQNGQSGEDQKGSQMTKWARWAYENSSRLDEKGNLTDYAGRIFKESMALLQKDAANISPQSNTGLWTQLGPFNTVYGSNPQNFRGLGRVDRIAFHPTDPNTIFAGTPAGGLWRTTDNGTNWSLLTRYLPSPGISGVVVSSDNPNSIFILTGDGDSNLGGGLVNLMGYVRRSVGVLRSTDGGNTWFLTGAFPNATANMVGYKLVQDPTNPAELIAATSEGLYRTTNSGGTWTRVRTGRFWDVAYRTGSSTLVYATGDGNDRFIRSTDGGNIWFNTGITWNQGTPSGTGRGQLAVGVSATSAVYILWGPVTGNGSFRGLYYSSDAGLTWDRQTTTPNVLGNAELGNDNNDQSNYDLAFTLRPNNSANIFVGGITVWSSTDRGVTMTKSTSFRESGSFAYIHPDIHDLKYHPTNGWLYAATDGGMYRSNDNGATWVDISEGIATTQFYKGSGFAGNNNLFLGGAQDNGVLYRNGNTTDFRFVLCCDGFDGEFYPDDASKAYVSMNQSVFRLNLNGGGSDISPWENGKWFINVATHPSNGDIVYVGADSMARSVDQGVIWIERNATDAGWALTSCPSNTNRLYAAGGNSPWAATGNIRRSDDQGDTWTNINGTTFAPTNLKVTDITPRPNNSAHVWATIGGFSDGNKVFRTLNGSADPPTWTNLSGNLPNVPVNCVAVDADNNAYIGTDIGVYYRGTSMSDWVPFYNFIPRVPVTSLIINEISGFIKAVTFGHGVWQSPVYSACQANLALSGSNTGYKVYEAGSTLTSTAVIFGGDNTEVFYKSGGSITLQEGFHARSNNSIFKAYLGPCGNGLPTQNDAGQTEKAVQQIERTTLYPNGSIVNVPAGNAGMVEINVPVDGNYRLVAINEQSQAIAEVGSFSISSIGKTKVSISQKPPNAFYLQLWLGDTLCDQKEW